MNQMQRRAVTTGLVVAALVGLFPPWQRSAIIDGSRMTVQMGHAPLFIPPRGEGFAPITYSISAQRLVAYWAVILLATLAAYFSFGAAKTRGTNEQRPNSDQESA